MEDIKILDKSFKIFLTEKQIQEKISSIAKRLNNKLTNKKPIFISILNGSFMFASDLYKQITVPSIITFLKLASYEGTKSTEKTKLLIGINEVLENKTIVIIEDIIDTGITINDIVEQLKKYKPKEIIITTLLFKPETYNKNINIDYYAFKIPDNFIVGYGLDYNGFGRNLTDIYTIKN